MPKTFDSEIRDVHERRGDRSFSNEFRGASDSFIERDRPVHPTDIARRSRRLMFGLILSLALLGGGGFAVWFWSEPIGAWIASWTAEPEPAPAEAEAEPVVEPEPELEPVVTEPPKVFGVKGAPEGSEPWVDPPLQPEPAVDPPIPSGESLPVEPLDQPPTPVAAAASVTETSTTVRGQVATSTVRARLAVVDTALANCWTTATAKPETKRPTTLTLRFTIKWSGRLQGITVSGDAPSDVQRCAREAVPTAAWPEPRDGGDAQVVRVWTLE